MATCTPKLTKQQRHKDWQKSLSRLEGAYAEGTLRAYKADIQAYVEWCELKKRLPFPATPRLLANFVTDEAKRCSGATIKRRLAAIGKIHRLMKLENPVADEDVKLALRRDARKTTSLGWGGWRTFQQKL